MIVVCCARAENRREENLARKIHLKSKHTHTHRRLRAKESVNKTIAREKTKTKTRLEETVNQRVTVVFNFETTVQDLRCLLPALPERTKDATGRRPLAEREQQSKEKQPTKKTTPK